MAETKCGKTNLSQDGPGGSVRLVPVPIRDQPADYLYEMALIFSTEIVSNSAMSMMLPIKKDMEMTQVVPFIPDEPTLDKYADTIKTAYNQTNSSTRITSISFKGYKYLRMVRRDEPGPGAG